MAAAERAADFSRVAGGRIAIACVLAWLVPGAGHWYFGRRARAAVFFTLVTGSFVLGTIFNGRFSVITSGQPYLTVCQVAACLGSGPMEIITRSVLYGGPVYKMPDEDAHEPGEKHPPKTRAGQLLRSRNEAFDSAYGTAYLWAAGLMNILLLLDVFDIGIGRKD